MYAILVLNSSLLKSFFLASVNFKSSAHSSAELKTVGQSDVVVAVSLRSPNVTKRIQEKSVS